MDTIIRVSIRPYRIKELAKIYGMSSRTLRRNLKGIKERLGPRNGHFYSIAQVEIIVEHLGRPYIIIEEEKEEP